jgi:magnesium-transporting ATPase (P-type)
VVLHHHAGLAAAALQLVPGARAAGRRRAFNADHLSRYGYSENRASNPDNLPLGFVKDLEQDQLGLTCAACHTNESHFAGKTWRIDGAPTDADTWAFLRDLGTTLQETAASQSAIGTSAFAAKVTARTRRPRARSTPI